MALALVIGAGLWALEGAEAGEAYFAGYAMEKALSVEDAMYVHAGPAPAAGVFGRRRASEPFFASPPRKGS